nr:putative Conserved Cystein/Glycine domain [Haemonchus contortus]
MGGCKCDIVEGDLNTEIEFDTNEDCRKPIEMVTADNKKKLNKEIEQKFGGFKGFELITGIFHALFWVVYNL